jgi:hypothetical protein
VDDALLGSQIDTLIHLSYHFECFFLLSFLYCFGKLTHHGFHDGLVGHQTLVASDTLFCTFSSGGGQRHSRETVKEAKGGVKSGFVIKRESDIDFYYYRILIQTLRLLKNYGYRWTNTDAL